MASPGRWAPNRAQRSGRDHRPFPRAAPTPATWGPSDGATGRHGVPQADPLSPPAQARVDSRGSELLGGSALRTRSGPRPVLTWRKGTGRSETLSAQATVDWRRWTEHPGLEPLYSRPSTSKARRICLSRVDPARPRVSSPEAALPSTPGDGPCVSENLGGRGGPRKALASSLAGGNPPLVSGTPPRGKSRAEGGGEADIGPGRLSNAPSSGRGRSPFCSSEVQPTPTF